MELLQQYQAAAAYIQARCAAEGKADYAPQIGVVLGSGLAGLADRIEDPVIIPYADIPHFASSTAPGHKSRLLVGILGGKCVVAMQGRFHYYEGYSMDKVTFPIRCMHFLGVKRLFVSNAAGGVNPKFKVGDLMIIQDHINLLPNPLIGKNIPELGPRFCDMTFVYSKDLIRRVEALSKILNIPLQKGVYVAGSGPSYETIAEYRYFATIGADAVGMSTTPEVIVARHCGMEIFGMSVISNQAVSFDDDYKNDEQDVIDAAAKASGNMSTIITELLKTL
jgi:purine-nucleoside phosphorylase